MSKKIELDFEKIFYLAKKYNEIEVLENNLFLLYLLNRQSYEISHIFKNKNLTAEQKIAKINQKLGISNSVVFNELLYLLLKYNLETKIYYIYGGYNQIIYKKLNRIIVQLFTPLLLSDQLISEIKPKLEKMFSKEIILKNFVDESLLGGMVLKLPNGQFYDFSLKKSLLNLKYYLLGTNNTLGTVLK